MTGGATGVRLSVKAAHLCIPMPGEVQNGDAVLFRENEHGHAMLAVVDGLGHGPDAAKASRAAVEQLSLLPVASPVLDAMQAVHRALKNSRGAAATVCVISGSRLEVCAVGNVQFMCVGFTIPLVLSAGVLGHQVARFRVGVGELRAGARIALVSDGVSSRFRLEELKAYPPDEACRLIMQRHRRKEDDATVLVADIGA